MEIIMVGASIQVGTDPNGGKAVIAQDPSGIRVIMPLTADAARSLAGALSGGIYLAASNEVPGR